MNIRSKISSISCVPKYACMTVECVTMAPVPPCVLAGFPCHLAAGERENKLPPIFGRGVITGLGETKERMREHERGEGPNISFHPQEQFPGRG